MHGGKRSNLTLDPPALQLRFEVTLIGFDFTPHPSSTPSSNRQHTARKRGIDSDAGIEGDASSSILNRDVVAAAYQSNVLLLAGNQRGVRIVLVSSDCCPLFFFLSLVSTGLLDFRIRHSDADVLGLTALHADG